MASKLPDPPKRPKMERAGLAKLQELRRLTGGVCIGCTAVKAASRIVESMLRRK